MAPTGLIGVIHLPPMPGDPLHDSGSGFQAVVDAATRDLEALLQGGVDQVIVENFGSAPFTAGRVAPHVVALMTRVVEASRTMGATVGVNCLRNDAISAVGIAAACGASFVRVNVLTGASVTDQGLIEGEAHSVLRYRRQLGADDVAILADVLVKHAEPLVATSPERAALDTAKRGLADGLIVTGAGTGAVADDSVLDAVASADVGVPLFVGSGVTPDAIDELAPKVDGLIVGTYLKVDGDVRAPVDPSRVRELVERWRAATSET